MRLPKEPLMAENYYQAHAWKLVERERKSIESSLNMTIQQRIFNGLATIAILGVVVLLFIYVSFLAAIIGALVSVAVGVVCSFFLPSHPPEYGVWQVFCDRGRFVRGDIVRFRCERIVEGDIVEEITKD